MIEAKKGTRYHFIDTIRGIAAYSVILQHSLYQSGLLGDWPGSTLTGFIPTWLELGETGVVAFFLVSGFVIPLSIEKTINIKLFWLHRALRIYPLYLTVFFIGVLIFSLDNRFSLRHWAVIFSSHLLFIQEYLKQTNFVGGSWTLSLELVWYIGIATIFALGRLKDTGAIVVTTIAISLVAQASCAVGWHVPMGRLSMLVCCVIGFVCYRRTRQELSQRRFQAMLAGLLATVALNMWVGEGLFPSAHPTATFRMVSLSWTLAALVFFVPFFTRQSRLWSQAAFSFAGRISYSLYLLHPVVLTLLSMVALRGVWLVCATVILTTVASTVTYRFIESPAIRLGHAQKRRPPPAGHPRLAD